MNYRHLGKERRLSLCAYPGVSLAVARIARDRVHQLLDEGQDPAEVLREERILARETQPAGSELIETPCLKSTWNAANGSSRGSA